MRRSRESWIPQSAAKKEQGGRPANLLSTVAAVSLPSPSYSAPIPFFRTRPRRMANAAYRPVPTRMRSLRGRVCSRAQARSRGYTTLFAIAAPTAPVKACVNGGREDVMVQGAWANHNDGMSWSGLTRPDQKPFSVATTKPPRPINYCLPTILVIAPYDDRKTSAAMATGLGKSASSKSRPHKTFRTCTTFARLHGSRDKCWNCRGHQV